MRLFVAVWPPDDVIDLISGLRRPDVAGLRWTVLPQWHVTLRFLGEVTDADAVSDALRVLTGSTTEQAVLGPATAWFPGSRVLQVPVSGLEELSRRVCRSIEHVDRGRWAVCEPEPRFRGHLTLARVRGRARMDRDRVTHLEGVAVSAEWTVSSFSLVSSTLRPDGAVYSDVSRVELSAPV